MSLSLFELLQIDRCYSASQSQLEGHLLSQTIGNECCGKLFFTPRPPVKLKVHNVEQKSASLLAPQPSKVETAFARSTSNPSRRISSIDERTLVPTVNREIVCRAEKSCDHFVIPA